MYRVVDDFLQDWLASANGALSVFKAMTNETLDYSIVEGHNSLGWLAWHLVGATGSISKHVIGLDVPCPRRDEAVPSSVNEIVQRYEIVATALLKEAEKLTAEDLLVQVQGFNGMTTKGKMLAKIIEHQTHHIGQMTVLLRQAGLTVPPVAGPTAEMRKPQ